MESETIPAEDQHEFQLPEVSGYLTDINILNKIFNYYVNLKVPIEIKVCQKLKSSGQEKYSLRTGGFHFCAEKVAKLTNQNGYYLFIVKDDDIIIRMKMILASDIKYKRFIMWTRLMED